MVEETMAHHWLPNFETKLKKYLAHRFELVVVLMHLKIVAVVVAAAADVAVAVAVVVVVVVKVVLLLVLAFQPKMLGVLELY
ncbi:hypothetical protein WN51_04798 [Melipona quadrifasciata]|uniref:Uncharacterized protein n=1 Tax=Melipona quadrifasciata TaxID=166423 RepID=A0A0M8ZSS9_9HYME|nr:hypothetical protein WN51_04798 [Melipona quadrifasciata]